MKKLAILGPGLLGASLAMAARARYPECHIALWARREEAAEEVRQAQIAQSVGTELAPIVAEAELIVLCVPVEVMPKLAKQLAPFLAPGALVTDVGSVKGIVEQTVGSLLPPGRFIGSHPMAGSEQSGLAAARRDLFEGSVCIITPEEPLPGGVERGVYQAALERVTQFWSDIGCDTRLLSPGVHDRFVGLISHLPHLVAAAQVDFVCSEDANALNFCGNGFRDSTRIASGPAEMWAGIFASNRVALSGALKGFIASLQRLSEALEREEDGQIKDFLTRAKTERDRLKPKA